MIGRMSPPNPSHTQNWTHSYFGAQFPFNTLFKVYLTFSLCSCLLSGVFFLFHDSVFFPPCFVQNGNREHEGGEKIAAAAL